jgi:hypothetical protein
LLRVAAADATNGRATAGSQGLSTLIPQWEKSATLRVATVAPWGRAVAALSGLEPPKPEDHPGQDTCLQNGARADGFVEAVPGGCRRSFRQVHRGARACTGVGEDDGQVHQGPDPQQTLYLGR